MMKDNLEILELGWDVPQDAKKPISGGRLNGKTDISPMWRIKRLTEMFGPCGIGWWYVIKDQRLLEGADKEVKAFVDIDLYFRWGEQVSQPIPGPLVALYQLEKLVQIGREDDFRAAVFGTCLGGVVLIQRKVFASA